jgi:PKHD-type hydroxylase
MRYDYYYYYFKSVIPERLCDDIIKYGKSKNPSTAITGSDYIDPKTNEAILSEYSKKLRKSKTAWLSDLWLYKEIQPYLKEANKKSGWNFQWDFCEPLQFTEYGLNEHYDWHVDAWNQPYKDHKTENLNGKIRKISMTLSLNNFTEYTGGELEFDFREKGIEGSTEQKCTEILPKGSIVFFPSFVWHRVRPVTKGIRYSLVMWACGNPFI